MKAGNRKRWIVGFVAVVVVVLVAVAVWPGPKEPEYEGKKLSEWLELQPLQSRESAEAVRAIGTNAVPFLTRWVEFELPPWRLRLLRTYAKVPNPLRINKVGSWVVDSDAQRRAANAVNGFQVLGDWARSAVPELARYIADPAKLDYSRVAIALAYAGGEEALPPLLTALEDKSRPAIRRTSCAVAIGRVKYRGPELKQAIPVLISCVQETNQFVPSVAAATLGTLGIQAEICVPVLSNATRSADVRLRRNSVRALGEFGPAARSALNVVTNATNDSDWNVKKEATNALAKITGEMWATNVVSEGHE